VLFYGGGDFHSWKTLLERGHAESSESEPSVLAATIDRLGRMMGYATRGVCRHKQLVEYFGQRWEFAEDGCGACDVCLGELEALVDSVVVAQKILSCAARRRRASAARVTTASRRSGCSPSARCRRCAPGSIS
jgi:ATP-dependent DNA helicase RecQ